MKASRKLLVAILALVVGVLVGGCAAPQNELRLADIGWDENTAVANLTKALLEEELDYTVEIQTVDLGLVFQGVRTGDLDAFQDVWLPNHRHLLDEVQGEVEHLDNWYQGQTEFGIGVPAYVNITSIPQLNDTGIQEILGIEPGAVISEVIPEDVIPTYDLNQEYVTSSTAGMLAEVERRYDNGEEFAFTPWRPHWMNQRYEIRYLEDPEDALGVLNDSATISTIVREGLAEDNPPAYAFMNALTLTEAELNDLENTINQVGDPLEGAR